MSKSQYEREKEFIEYKLFGFKVEESKAVQVLQGIFGEMPTHKELISISKILSFVTKIRIHREYYRKKITLIKWLDQNISIFSPLLNRMIIGFYPKEIEEK